MGGGKAGSTPVIPSFGAEELCGFLNAEGVVTAF